LVAWQLPNFLLASVKRLCDAHERNFFDINFNLIGIVFRFSRFAEREYGSGNCDECAKNGDDAIGCQGVSL
jgi:hypothetical protein